MDTRAEAPWGKRLRKPRRKIWEAAITLRQQWEEKFGKWNEDHGDQTVPQVVVVNGNLNATRIAEAQRAVALLPKDEHGQPDPNAPLDEGIEFARKHGWPVCDETIKVLVTEFLKCSEHRSKLKWQENNYIAPATLESHKADARLCIKLFGDETMSSINSIVRQEDILRNWEQKHGMLPPYSKADALKFLSMTGSCGVDR